MNSGLENPANVCFANSIIQALSACPLFIFYLLANKENPNLSERHLHFNNKLLFILLSLNHFKQPKMQKIDELVDELQSTGLNFAEQQDSHEFLKLLCEKLEDVEEIKVNCKNSLMGINHMFSFEEWTYPFKGKLMETLICFQCNNKGVSKISDFTDFTFLINFRETRTVDQLFTDFFKSENLEGVYCAFCSLQKFKKFLPIENLKTVENELALFSVSDLQTLETLGDFKRNYYRRN